MADKTADKRNQILVTALQLFSTKGSAATSMQEIAEVCGMSKGSLYLHFKSKEELEKSIYEYIFMRIQDEIIQIDQNAELAPREQLRRQAEVLLVHSLELQEFIIKQLHDYPSPGSPPFDQNCAKQELYKAMMWFRNKLGVVYGEQALPYAVDTAFIFGGMLGSYIRILFIPGLQINVAMLADHLITLLDDVMENQMRRRANPLVPLDIWERYGGLAEAGEPVFPRHPLILIKAMKTQLKELPLTESVRSDSLESLSMLETELLGARPRRIVLKGMLSNLEGVPGLEEPYRELHTMIHGMLDLYLTPDLRKQDQPPA